MGPDMTPEQLKRLHKLLKAFARVYNSDMAQRATQRDEFNRREQQVIDTVASWVKYYAEDMHDVTL